MKKISVMIVDDEKLVLEDLTTIVDWDAIGFEIVATAVNGKQALNKFQQYHPQIVFTDIKMPFMDGIELIAQLRKYDAQTQILLLTAYEDFAYAKSAIKYGITDYIIKSTINSQFFSNLLNRLKAIIDNQGKVHAILKDKEISDYFNANDELVQAPDKELFTMPYCYLLIEQAMPINLSGDSGMDTIRYQKADVITTLIEGENSDYDIVAVSNTSWEQILLVLDIRKISQKSIYQIVLACAMEKKRKLEEQLQMEFKIYMVSSKISLVNLKCLYRKSKQFFYRSYLTGSKEVLDLMEYRSESAEDLEETAPDTGRIGEFLEKLDEQGMRTYIENLYLTIVTSDSYKSLCAVSRELYDLLKRNYKRLPAYTEKPDLSFAANWRHWMNAKQLSKWFIDRFTELIHANQTIYQNRYSKTTVGAMEYIKHQYSDSGLSINNVADHVERSTGHLCVLFKKETGKTLNHYISEVRISEAKRLLNEKQLKVYEISSAVGFQSSQYFSQVFHKQVGIYPNEYQKGKRLDAK